MKHSITSKKRDARPNVKKSTSQPSLDKSKRQKIINSQSSDQKDKIKTFLRIRSLIGNEKVMDYNIDGSTITIKPPPTSSYFCIDKSFTFSKIFDQETSQEIIFNQVALPLLTDFCKGNDGFIFCYGCANSGKKYTANGSYEKPGLIRRTLDYIVPQLIGSSDYQCLKLTSTYFEIYHENIFDLLNPSKKPQALKFLNENNGEIVINSIVEFQIKSMEDSSSLIEKMEAGIDRAVNCFNHDISHSHIIFRLKLTWKKQISYFSIIVLGECESFSENNSKKYFNMNKSILSLRKNIRLLKESKSNNASIPYRESKITSICKSLFELHKFVQASIIINISPSIYDIENSIFSQKFVSESSKTSVRQVAKVEDIERKDLNSEPTELNNEKYEDETEQEIEFRLRAQLKREMQQYIIEKEEQYRRQIEIINSTCQSIFLSKFEPTLFTDSSKTVEDILKNQIKLKQNQINQIKKKISESEIEEKELVDKLNKAKEELNKIHENTNAFKSCNNIYKHEET